MMDGGVTAIGEDMGGDEEDAGIAEGDVYSWRQLDCCFGDWGGGVIWLSAASFCEEDEE